MRFPLFSKILYEAMLRAGVADRAIASAAGISNASMSRYKRGARVPDRQALRRLAAALDVSERDLWTPEMMVLARSVEPPPIGDGFEPSRVAETAVIIGWPTVGAGTQIGHRVIIDALGGPVIIGERCDIGHGAQIYGAHTSAGREFEPIGVIIGDECIINPGAIICPGVTLPQRTVVGTGAIWRDM